MRRSILLTLLAAAMSGPALAAPVTLGLGDFSVANTGTLVGDPIQPGSAVLASATELQLAGGDAGVGCDGGVFSNATSPCALMVTLGRAGDYSFHWDYSTADGFGPGADLFGVVVDGLITLMSDPGGSVSQSGSASFTASSSFGWFINCTDCTDGSASVSITQFSTTAVPEPATAALVLAALAGVAGVSRRRLPAG